MNSPLVSVLMLCHNRPQFMRAGIESVLAQTFADFEFIILDNGSTGDSVFNVAQEYAQRDSRIRLSRSESNLGVHGGRNTLLSNAAGEYIATIEDDDYWALDKLQKQVEFMQAHPLVGVYACSLFNINVRGEIIGESLLSESLSPATTQNSDLIIKKNNGSGQMFRRDALLAVGGWRDYFINADDTDLFYRLQEKYGYATTSQKLIYYRCADKTKTAMSIYNNLSRRSDSPLYILAALTSAWLRRNNREDPINHSPPVKKFLAENLPLVLPHLSKHFANKKGARRLIKLLLRSGSFSLLKEFMQRIAQDKSGVINKKYLYFYLCVWSVWYARLGYWVHHLK